MIKKQKVAQDKVRGYRKNQLRTEAKKLDPKEERALAEKGMTNEGPTEHEY